MVGDPSEYPWSSYRANGLGKTIELWCPHRVYRQLGTTLADRASAYRELFSGQLDKPTLNSIRQAVNQGMALGSERFKSEIERLAGRRVVPMRRGPKPKERVEFLL